MRKKYLLLAVSLTMAMSMMVACGGSSEDEGSTTTVAQGESGSENTSEDQSSEDQSSEEQSSEDESKEEETSFEPESVVYEGDIYSLPNDSVTWGVGIHTFDDGRPVSPVQLQEQYGDKYAVEFIKEDEKVIYLTFDEGYENGYTPQILDTLKEKNVKAVFFITMPYAKTEPELVQRMIDEGHVVGSHSVTHPSAGMPSISVEQQINEYKELHEYVLENFGYEMWLFRPPTGAFSEQSLAVAQHCGYRSIMWSFAYADWDVNKQWEISKALTNAVDKLHNGAVYLLHAVSATNTEMLGDFIDQTREKGYEFKFYE